MLARDVGPFGRVRCISIAILLMLDTRHPADYRSRFRPFFFLPAQTDVRICTAPLVVLQPFYIEFQRDEVPGTV